MAYLQVRSGANPGFVFRLDKETTVVGRTPGCDVLFEASTVSREHAAIVGSQNEYYVQDLGSRNGTYLNEDRLRPLDRKLLEDGDELRISNWCLVFRHGDPGYREDSSMTELVVDRPEPMIGGQKAARYGPMGGSLLEECRHLGDCLEHNHIHFPDASEVGLNRALIESSSEVLETLGQGFHRVIVFDARNGLNADGCFELTLFLRSATERMADAFGLHLEKDEYHPEEISQILKDERRSLFCFLNIQFMSTADLQRLRAFTQEQHQALFCGPHDFGRHSES